MLKTFYTWITSPFEMLLISDGIALTGLYFKNQKYIPQINKDWEHIPTLPIFKKTQIQLREYTEGKRTTFDLEIKFTKGTSFQQKVWSELPTIAAGSTISYAQLAARLSFSKSTRAVASAVGKNPISLIVPCHRVIGSDGSLRGYAAGLAIKQHLLIIEQHLTPIP